MVGLQVLVLTIGVRIPVPEQRKIPLKLAEFFVYPDSRIEPEFFLNYFSITPSFNHITLSTHFLSSGSWVTIIIVCPFSLL
ncbi:MAG: hypothetical protein UV18_C0010G0020, partial [Candidatus Magasanikbacteria bacterium GW2011_GWC2_42_27]